MTRFIQCPWCGTGGKIIRIRKRNGYYLKCKACHWEAKSRAK